MKNKILGVIACLFTILAISKVDAAPTNSNWPAIVTKMTNSTAIKGLKEEGNTVTITSNDSQMVITVSNDELTSPVKLTYYYTNDIVAFISTNSTSNTKVAKIESIINKQLIQAVAEYYGYDVNLLQQWMNEVDKTTLTVGNDGIEFTTYTSQDNSVTSYKTLKVNISCGFSAFNESTPTTPEETPTTPEEPTTPPDTSTPEIKPENPQTGIYVSTIIVAVAVIGGIILLISNKKNYFKEI